MGRTAKETARSHFRARAKMTTDILKTVGLATTAGGFLEPLLREGGYSLSNWLVGGFGVAVLLAALYIAPYGEKHE